MDSRKVQFCNRFGFITSCQREQGTDSFTILSKGSAKIVPTSRATLNIYAMWLNFRHMTSERPCRAVPQKSVYKALGEHTPPTRLHNPPYLLLKRSQFFSLHWNQDLLQKTEVGNYWTQIFFIQVRAVVCE